MEESSEQLKLQIKKLELELKLQEVRLQILQLERANVNSSPAIERKEEVQTSSLLAKKLNVVPNRNEQQEVSDTSAKAKSHEASSSSTQPQRVLVSPADFVSKITAIPSQTAVGKELSKPLMVNILPKDVTPVQTVPSTQDVNLRPDTGRKISAFSGISIPENKAQNYYVVFEGNHRGIFTSWELAKKMVEGHPGNHHQKYRSFEAAQAAAVQYAAEKQIDPLKVISKIEDLKTYAGILQKLPEKMTVLGQKRAVVQQPKKVEEKVYQIPKVSIEIDSVNYLLDYARRVTEEDALSQKCFITSGKNFNHYNFIRGAELAFVQEATLHGFTKLIYPSDNLAEIRFMPQKIYQGIRQFRKNSAYGRNVFLKISSSLPIFKNSELFLETKFIVKIGICKEEIYNSSINPQAIFSEEYAEYSWKKLNGFISEVFKFTEEDKIAVHAVEENWLLYSNDRKKISQLHQVEILNFQQKIFQIQEDKDEEYRARLESLLKKASLKDGSISGESSQKGEDFPPLKDAERQNFVKEQDAIR